MTRAEIRQKFRDENPDLTEHAISDATLNSWMLSGNLEICTLTRCIVTDESETFNAVIDQRAYELTTLIDNFYDVDDMPGGGVYYDDRPLKKKTIAEMDSIRRLWKTEDSGRPLYYWRRGKKLFLHPIPDDDLEIAVDAVLIPDAFSSDAIMPYNQLPHLAPFHDGIVKYLQFRAKGKVGKPEEAASAKKEYMDYVAWMKKTVRGASQGAVFMRNASSA